MHAWLSFAYAAYGFIFNFCSCMCRGSRVRVRLCLRERGGCFLFFFLFFVKLTHTFYYIDEQEGMFVARLPSIPCPFIHPLHMCIVYWYNPKWMSSRKRRLVRDSGDVAASQRPNKIGASFWRFFYCGCCCCWQGRLSSFYVLWLFGRFFFFVFWGKPREWMDDDDGFGLWVWWLVLLRPLSLFCFAWYIWLYDYDFLAFYDDLFCGLLMKILKELKNL